MIGKLVKIVLAVAVLSGVGLGGLYATGTIGVPDAGLEDNAWGEVDDERIEVVTTVWIDNPNPVSVDGVDVDYAIAMNEVSLADGVARQVSVASGNTTTELRTDLYYENLPAWWASHVGNDEVSDLRVDAQVHAEAGPLSGSPSVSHDEEIETDLEVLIEDSLAETEGEYHLSPVSVGADTVEPTVVIEDTDAAWGAVDDERTELYLTYHVHNPNPYPLPTPAFTGDLEFNDRHVAAWDAHEVELLRGAYDTHILPGETREITFVAEMDNGDVVAWFATHVDNDELSDAEMTSQLAMSINGQTVTLPPEGEAFRCSYDMQTSIFVDQDAGLSDQTCDPVPWATPDEGDFEELGATLELTMSDLEDVLAESVLGDDGSDDDSGGWLLSGLLS
ncbi:LEA/WHy family protein [Natrialbaceae archaeon A-gly3]